MACPITYGGKSVVACTAKRLFTCTHRTCATANLTRLSKTCRDAGTDAGTALLAFVVAVCQQCCPVICPGV